MNEVALKLDPKEFEYIINILAQRPFGEVNNLLQKMVQQANQQVAPQPAND